MQVLLPLELRSRKRPKPLRNPTDKRLNIDEKLSELEKNDSIVNKKEEEKDIDSEEEDELKVAEERRREKEMESDRESGEGEDEEAHDYGENYFDNGEEYLMGDDLGGEGGGDEDGPVY